MMAIATCVDGDIQLGNLVFNTVDSNGVRWIVSDLEGWWTLPEPEIPDFPRAADDGSYLSTGRYQARVFSLIGSFLVPSQAAVAPARAQLIAAANLCRQSSWFLTRTGGYTIGSQVVLSGTPGISTINITGRTDFSIGLKAVDPIKYALSGGTLPGYYTATRAGDGALTATNEGNYPVLPIITVDGPTDGPFTITNSTTGEIVSFRDPIQGGSSLVLNCQDRTVTLETGTTINRNQRFYLYWDTDWLTINPGANTITVAGAPTSVVTIEWRHGWIG
jgi:hypothetical protein